MKYSINGDKRANHRIVTVQIGFILCFFSLSLVLNSAKAADQTTPAGVWKTIDDATHKPKSHVQIWERNGIFYGKIIKLIDPDEPNPLCNKCDGKNKDKPVIGMRIMWNLKKNGDSEWGMSLC